MKIVKMATSLSKILVAFMLSLCSFQKGTEVLFSVSFNVAKVL